MENTPKPINEWTDEEARAYYRSMNELGQNAHRDLGPMQDEIMSRAWNGELERRRIPWLVLTTIFIILTLGLGFIVFMTH